MKPQARSDVAVRRFELRRIAFLWQAGAHRPDGRAAAVLDAAERHLQERHARIEREADGRALRFGRGSAIRRSWLGAIRDGRLQVSESDGQLKVTVHAVVARTLVICALPALLLIVLGAWPLGLMFVAVAAANLWFVDRGARQLIDAALE